MDKNLQGKKGKQNFNFNYWIYFFPQAFETKEGWAAKTVLLQWLW